MDNLDLDINNYSEDELYSLIKYEGDNKNASPIQITNQVNKVIGQCVQKYKNMDFLESFIPFLNEVNDKLIEYSEIRNPVQYYPTNYNILQSQNQTSGGTHSITTDKIIPVLNVNDYQLPAGVINPIERRTVKKIISIDSVFRENYNNTSSSDFVWFLPNREYKVVSIKLVSLELPVMWYSISEKNNSNTFSITTYNIKGLPDKTHKIEMPSGNYMASEFGIALTNYMLNKAEGLQYLICTINSITSKTVIRCRENLDGGENIFDVSKDYYSPEFYFSIDFGENNALECDIGSTSQSNDWLKENNEDRYSQYCLGSFLGFTKRYYEVRKEDTYTDYVYNGNNIITYECFLQSESSYGNGRTNYIFVSVDDYNNNYINETIIASSLNNYLGTNILGRISVNETYNAILMNTISDKIFKQRDYMGPINLNKFHIKLLDKYGQVIDLNNNDVSLAIELTILYN